MTVARSRWRMMSPEILRTTRCWRARERANRYWRWRRKMAWIHHTQPTCIEIPGYLLRTFPPQNQRRGKIVAMGRLPRMPAHGRELSGLGVGPTETGGTGRVKVRDKDSVAVARLLALNPFQRRKCYLSGCPVTSGTPLFQFSSCGHRFSVGGSLAYWLGWRG